MNAARRSFLVGGLTLAGRVKAGGQDPPPGPKLGVVALRSCFDKTKYARMAELAEDLVKLKNDLDKENRDLQKRIADLSEQMEAAKNSPELFVDKLRLRAHAEYDLKLQGEVGKRRATARVADVETRVFADVRRIVSELAGDLQLDLVLRVDDVRLPEEDPQTAPGDRIAAREVLFHREALDLTAKVLARLNKDWANAWTCGACKRKVGNEKCPDCGAKRN
jgi:Skp family chaperone for outer membrane proteins